VSPARRRADWPALLAGSFGLLWLLALGGADLLDPRQIGWLLDGGDWGQHLTGWLFFRQSAWELPLGSIPDLAAPAGTTVGYTDSIPWLALLCKALDPVLPDPFTYIGWWLAACFVLQGVCGARLLRSAGLDERAAALGGCLLVAAPILSFRIGHDALCGHFLILAALELSFRRVAAPADRRRIVVGCLLWPALAAGVHPYLAAMVSALCAGALARLWLAGWLPAARAAALVVAQGALLLGLFTAFGYLGTGTTTTSLGFGAYSSDLLALLDSRRMSRFVPELGVARAQYEGFAYLGLGALLLAGVALVAALARRRLPLRDDWPSRIPTGLAILLLAVLAWSHVVTVRGVPLFDYSAATGVLSPLLETFRASGRFIWPLHYAVVVLACAGAFAALRARPRLRLLLFASAVALAAAEQLRYPMRDRFVARPAPVWSEVWGLAPEQYRSVSLYPPVINASGERLCSRGGVPARQLHRYALLAHALRLPFNSAYLARANVERARAACRITVEEVRGNRLAPDKLYLAALHDGAAFRAAAPDSRCAWIDGAWACVAGRNQDAFARALAERAVRPVPEPGGAPAAAAALAAAAGLAARRRAPGASGRR